MTQSSIPSQPPEGISASDTDVSPKFDKTHPNVQSESWKFLERYDETNGYYTRTGFDSPRVETRYLYKAARRGEDVFLLNPGSKAPLKGSHGYKDGTCDIDIINNWKTSTGKWWRNWKGTTVYNYAIVTGIIRIINGKKYFLLVVDTDGFVGRKMLKKIEKIMRRRIPKTVTVETPGKIDDDGEWTGQGRQYFYWVPVCYIDQLKSGRYLDGIDLKTTKNYVSGVGSVRTLGNKKSGKHVLCYHYVEGLSHKDLGDYTILEKNDLLLELLCRCKEYNGSGLEFEDLHLVEKFVSVFKAKERQTQFDAASEQNRQRLNIPFWRRPSLDDDTRRILNSRARLTISTNTEHPERPATNSELSLAPKRRLSPVSTITSATVSHSTPAPQVASVNAWYKRWYDTPPEKVPVGSRNDWTYRSARYLLYHGMRYKQVLYTLLERNARLATPLDESEVEKTCQSASNHPHSSKAKNTCAQKKEYRRLEKFVEDERLWDMSQEKRGMFLVAWRLKEEYGLKKRQDANIDRVDSDKPYVTNKELQMCAFGDKTLTDNECITFGLAIKRVFHTQSTQTTKQNGHSARVHRDLVFEPIHESVEKSEKDDERLDGPEQSKEVRQSQIRTATRQFVDQFFVNYIERRFLCHFQDFVNSG